MARRDTASIWPYFAQRFTMLETGRLLIRCFELSDVPAYSKIVADPEVMRLLTGKPQSLEEAQQYIEECIVSEEENGFSRYAVLLKKSQELSGFCGFKIFNDELDFGWRYAKAYWNKGYGTEAARVVMQYGLEVLKLPILVSIAFPENVASIRIMQKIGMDRDGCGEWNGRKTIRYVKRNH